jgi:hypothetical protein
MEALRNRIEALDKEEADRLSKVRPANQCWTLNMMPSMFSMNQDFFYSETPACGSWGTCILCALNAIECAGK